MKKNTKKIWIAVIVLVAAAVIFGVIYKFAGPKAQQGSKDCTIEVMDDKGEITAYELSTDVEYLRELMDEAAENEDFSYDGEDGDYGLFITEADGEPADTSLQQGWCITKGGETVNTSADQTPVQDNDKFELTLKEGY